MSSLPVKISLHDDTRRFSLAEPVKYARLEELTRQLFRLGNEAAISIRYADDEGELISLSSDEELQEAFAVSQSLAQKVLKLVVAVAGGGAGGGSGAPSLSRASCAKPRARGRAPSRSRGSSMKRAQRERGV